MNRKEKEKILLEVLNLKVGDVVEITFNTEQDEIEKAEIIEYEKEYRLKYDDIVTTDIYGLLQYNFTKLIPKKKKGELKCSSLKYCTECPLYTARCRIPKEKDPTLYEVFEETNIHYPMPDKVYEAYKELLDEEVKDE